MVPNPHAAPQAMMAIELPQPPRTQRRLAAPTGNGGNRKPSTERSALPTAPTLGRPGHTPAPPHLPELARAPGHGDRVYDCAPPASTAPTTRSYASVSTLTHGG